MLAKHLKRLLGGIAIAGLSFALAYPAFAQTTYKAGTSVNVGQPSSTQLSRDEINQQEAHDELGENTHHDQIDEELDSEDRAEDITHDLRIKQLEAAQTPYKPQHIADENQRHADAKKEIAQKKSIEAQRHADALERITAAAQALLSGAASALGNAANGGGGSPSGSSPPPNRGGGTASNPSNGGAPGSPNSGGRSAGNPNSGGSASNPNSGGGSPGNRYPGGAPNNPALGGSGAPAGNPNSGGGSASNPTYPGGINNYPIPGGGPGSYPNSGGGSASNPNYPGGVNNNPIPGGVSAGNPNSGSASNPNSGGSSASNPNRGGGSASNPNAGGGSPNSPRLTGNASSNASASNASSSGPGAGQRPLDFIPNALNGFVNQFQNGGQNLQNVSNAMRGVAQTFEDQWTKPNGGIEQLKWAAAGGIAGKGLKLLGPAIKGVAGKAAAAAPAAAAKAAAAATGFVGKARNAIAGQFAKLKGLLFGSTESSGPGALNEAEQAAQNGANAVNPAQNPAPQTLKGSANAAGENPPGTSNASEPSTSSGDIDENASIGPEGRNGVSNLANQTFKIGGKTFELGAMQGDPGTYGTVYELKNMPGYLLKVVKFGDSGARSIRTQLAGKELLAAAKTNIATPAMENVSTQDTNAMIVQDVTKAFEGGKAFNSTAVADAAQKAAIKTMFDEMAAKGLVGEDLALRNVFVYDTPDGLRAGILDTDRIFRFSEMGKQSMSVQGGLARKLAPYLKGTGMNPDRLTAQDYMDAVYEFYYGG